MVASFTDATPAIPWGRSEQGVDETDVLSLESYPPLLKRYGRYGRYGNHLINIHKIMPHPHARCGRGALSLGKDGVPRAIGPWLFCNAVVFLYNSVFDLTSFNPRCGLHPAS